MGLKLKILRNPQCFPQNHSLNRGLREKGWGGETEREGGSGGKETEGGREGDRTVFLLRAE